MIKAHLVKEYSVKYGSEFYISLDDFTSMLEKMGIDYFHNDESPFVEIVQHDLLNLARFNPYCKNISLHTNRWLCKDRLVLRNHK